MELDTDSESFKVSDSVAEDELREECVFAFDFSMEE